MEAASNAKMQRKLRRQHEAEERRRQTGELLHQIAAQELEYGPPTLLIRNQTINFNNPKFIYDLMGALNPPLRALEILSNYRKSITTVTFREQANLSAFVSLIPSSTFGKDASYIIPRPRPATTPEERRERQARHLASIGQSHVLQQYTTANQQRPEPTPAPRPNHEEHTSYRRPPTPDQEPSPSPEHHRQEEADHGTDGSDYASSEYGSEGAENDGFNNEEVGTEPAAIITDAESIPDAEEATSRPSTPDVDRPRATTLLIRSHTTKPDNPFFINNLINKFNLPVEIDDLRFNYRLKITTISFKDPAHLSTFMSQLPSNTFGNNATYSIPTPRQYRVAPQTVRQTEQCVMKNVNRDITEHEILTALNSDPRLNLHQARRILSKGIPTTFITITGESESIGTLLEEGARVLGRWYRTEPALVTERHHPCRRCHQYGHPDRTCRAPFTCHVCGGPQPTARCAHNTMVQAGVFKRGLYCTTCKKANSHYTGQMSCPSYPGHVPVPATQRPIVHMQPRPVPAPRLSLLKQGTAPASQDAADQQPDETAINITRSELNTMLQQVAADAARRAVDAMAIILYNMVSSDATSKLKEVVNSTTKQMFQERTIMSINMKNQLEVRHSPTTRTIPQSYAEKVASTPTSTSPIPSPPQQHSTEPNITQEASTSKKTHSTTAHDEHSTCEPSPGIRSRTRSNARHKKSRHSSTH